MSSKLDGLSFCESRFCLWVFRTVFVMQKPLVHVTGVLLSGTGDTASGFRQVEFLCPSCSPVSFRPSVSFQGAKNLQVSDIFLHRMLLFSQSLSEGWSAGSGGLKV